MIIYMVGGTHYGMWSAVLSAKRSKCLQLYDYAAKNGVVCCAKIAMIFHIDILQK